MAQRVVGILFGRPDVRAIGDIVRSHTRSDVELREMDPEFHWVIFGARAGRSTTIFIEYGCEDYADLGSRIHAVASVEATDVGREIIRRLLGRFGGYSMDQSEDPLVWHVGSVDHPDLLHPADRLLVDLETMAADRCVVLKPQHLEAMRPLVGQRDLLGAIVGRLADHHADLDQRGYEP